MGCLKAGKFHALNRRMKLGLPAGFSSGRCLSILKVTPTIQPEPDPDLELRRMYKALIALLTLAPLAACVAPQQQMPVPMNEPAPALSPVAGLSGLQSREPDGCRAGDYTSALGQHGSVIQSLGIRRDYRVAEYRGIEPQEYDPGRIVFRLDQAGNIYNIDCG